MPIEAVTIRSDTSTDAKSYKILREDKRDKKYEVVFILNEDKADLQVVKTGIQDDELIEIKKGLQEGQKIITGPCGIVSKELVNGSLLKIKKEKGD